MRDRQLPGLVPGSVPRPAPPALEWQEVNQACWIACWPGDARIAAAISAGRPGPLCWRWEADPGAAIPRAVAGGHMPTRELAMQAAEAVTGPWRTRAPAAAA